MVANISQDESVYEYLQFEDFILELNLNSSGGPLRMCGKILLGVKEYFESSGVAFKPEFNHLTVTTEEFVYEANLFPFNGGHFLTWLQIGRIKK